MNLNLSQHERAVVALCQKNMKEYLKYSINKLTPDELEDANWNIEYAWPLEFSKMITKRIAGIQPASGPSDLLLIKNIPVDLSNFKKLGFNSLDQYLRIRTIQISQDLCATYGRENLEKFEIPDKSEFPYLSQVCYSVLSLPLKEDISLAAQIDKTILNTALYVAQPFRIEEIRTMRAGMVAFFENGGYIVTHPRTSVKVPFELLLNYGIISEQMPENKILIGYKRSNYDASIYWMPYVPIDTKKVCQVCQLSKNREHNYVCNVSNESCKFEPIKNYSKYGYWCPGRSTDTLSSEFWSIDI